MGGPRTKLLLSILAILLVAFATADTLRLPQRRALKNKEEEEMLFTEGRKGGKASKIKGEKGSSNNSEDSWRSGDGADQWRSGDTTSGGKEKESTYDRPPMKIKGEKGSRKSEESVEEPTKKSTEKEAEEPKKGDEKGVEEKWSSVDPVTKGKKEMHHGFVLFA